MEEGERKENIGEGEEKRGRERREGGEGEEEVGRA
jgi:hypothetical protein